MHRRALRKPLEMRLYKKTSKKLYAFLLVMREYYLERIDECFSQKEIPWQKNTIGAF